MVMVGRSLRRSEPTIAWPTRDRTNRRVRRTHPASRKLRCVPPDSHAKMLPMQKNPSFRLLALSAAVAAAAVAISAQAAGLPAQVREVEGVHEYRLPNGLQVLLIPDESKPTVTVNGTYRA